MTSIHELLELAMKRRASDLVIKAGAKPSVRVDGSLQTLESDELNPQQTRDLAHSIIHSATRDYLLQYPDIDNDDLDGSRNVEDCMERLHERQDLDIVFTIPKLARVRANIFMERGCLGAALRIIPLKAYTIDELRLPPILKEMANQPQGLILITGPTGSGKTTTLAAMIEEINRNRHANIFTIEDPIEYVFTDKSSMVHQREVGSDTASFSSALKSVMRQSPDVIAIGEMRDAETMDVAMTAAEIGHLVIATLHTTSAVGTLDRIVNTFPEHQRSQVAGQLAASILCITSQRLVKRSTGPGRLPAVEVLTGSPTVKKQIEELERNELYSSMRDGQHFGMNTMNQALEKLCQSKQISHELALQFAGNPTELKQMLRNS